jgi:hypothetical protein
MVTIAPQGGSINVLKSSLSNTRRRPGNIRPYRGMYFSLRRAFMLKKSLVFGSIVLLLGMLLAFAACDNPAGPEGPPGPPGPTGPSGPSNPGTGPETPPVDPPPGPELVIPAGYVFNGFNTTGGAVTAAALAEAFTNNDVIVLGDGINSIYGEIPAGKALFVTNDDAYVANTGFPDYEALTLKIDGALNIWHGAKLYATGVDDGSGDDAGFLTGEGKITITGTGVVSLPYDPYSRLPLDHITYENITFESVPYEGPAYVGPAGSEEAQKAVGSIVKVGITELLDAANVSDLFTVPDALDAFTVHNIEDLGSATLVIPSGSKLTLAGTGNTLADVAANNIAPEGKLVIAGTLESQSTSTNVATLTAKSIEISEDGELKLTALDVFAGPDPMADDANKGKITTAATSAIVLNAMLGLINGEIEATAGITTGAVPSFIVEKDVSLALTNAATTFASVVDITVKGKLTLGVDKDTPPAVALVPTGDVVLFDNGTTATDDDGKLEVKADSSLAIGAGKKLTAASFDQVSGAGIIKADGGAATPEGTIDIGVDPDFEEYWTTSTGVVANDIPLALAAFEAESDTFENDITLVDAIDNANGTITAIGSLTLTDQTTSVGVGKVADGDLTGTPEYVTVGAGITPAGNTKGTDIGGTDITDFAVATDKVKFELSIESGVLKLKDTGFTGTEKKVYVTFDELRLQHTSGLISPTLDFNIGVVTAR